MKTLQSWDHRVRHRSHDPTQRGGSVFSRSCWLAGSVSPPFAEVTWPSLLCFSYKWTQERSVVITHCVHSEKEGCGKLHLPVPPPLSILKYPPQQLTGEEKQQGDLLLHRVIRACPRTPFPHTYAYYIEAAWSGWWGCHYSTSPL